MSSAFTVSAADPGRIAPLSRLMSRSFLAAYGHVAPPDRLARHMSTQHDAALIRERLREGQIEVLIASPGDQIGTLAGYVQLGVVPGDVPEVVGEPKAIELQRCYLAPEWIGSGAGPALMDSAQRRAIELDRPCLYLSVYQLAPRAVRFYERHGFVTRAAIAYHIDDIRYDDWLMVWRAAS
jgi:ribosomal protein S18 acetylase RimI-like enzyme